MGRRLSVGNLPYSTGETELQELFSKAGIESVRVMRDAATGRARGFAFVDMATDEEAQKAAAEFEGGLWRRQRRRTPRTTVVNR